MKENQNRGLFSYKGMTVETTMTKVIIYDANNEIIGQAGVDDSRDFDFEILYNFAIHKSGSKIQVA